MSILKNTRRIFVLSYPETVLEIFSNTSGVSKDVCDGVRAEHGKFLLGPYPQILFMVFKNAPHKIVLKTLLCGEGGEWPVLDSEQAAAVCPDPEVTFFVFEKRTE